MSAQEMYRQSLGIELLPRHTDTEPVIEGKLRKMVKAMADSMETMEMPQSNFMLVVGFDADNHYSSVIAHYILMHKILPMLPRIVADHKLNLVDVSEWLPGVLVIDKDTITPALSIKCKVATAKHGDEYSDFIREQALVICKQANDATENGEMPQGVEAALNVLGARRTRH